MISELKLLVAGRDQRLIGTGILIVLLAAIDLKSRVFHVSTLERHEKTPEEPKGLSVSRPPPEWAELFAPVKEEQASTIPKTPEIDEEAQSGELTTLVINQKTYALRACFLHSKKRAVAAVTETKEHLDSSLYMLSIGQALGPYSVTAINKTSITLKTQAGREVILRLFRPQASKIEEN